VTGSIYLIEDEPTLALGIVDNLELEGYRCQHFTDGQVGLDACLASPPDLLILDLGLPGREGLAVLSEIRKAGLAFPVLILTARSSEVDVLKGFRKGASDYVTKPFSPRILLARIAALLNRFQAHNQLLQFGQITVDLQRMEATGVHLTTREFQVLAFLAKFRGQPVSRTALLDEVWGMDSESTDRAVDTMILELRKKVEPQPSHPRFILTQRGLGYKLAEKAFQDVS